MASCRSIEFFGSYEEALDAVRHFEDSKLCRFPVVKRRVYDHGRKLKVISSVM